MASCYRATKLLYKKLESSILDYLSLSIASYTRTLGLIGDRGIARAGLSVVHTCTYVKYVVRMCTIKPDMDGSQTRPLRLVTVGLSSKSTTP